VGKLLFLHLGTVRPCSGRFSTHEHSWSAHSLTFQNVRIAFSLTEFHRQPRLDSEIYIAEKANPETDGRVPDQVFLIPEL
jgi:hypothetical protein